MRLMFVLILMGMSSVAPPHSYLSGQTNLDDYGSWGYQWTIDPITDDLTSEVAYAGNRESNLRVACDSLGNIRVFILTNKPFSGGAGDAIVRFDLQDPLPVEQWTIHDLYPVDAVSIRPPDERIVDFMERARAGARVVIRVSQQDSGSERPYVVDFIFDLYGFTAATRRLSCT